MLEATTVFLLESVLVKVRLEDGAVVTHIRATTPRRPHPLPGHPHRGMNTPHLGVGSVRRP